MTRPLNAPTPTSSPATISVCRRRSRSGLYRLIAASLISVLPGTALSGSVPLLAQTAAQAAPESVAPSNSTAPHSLTIVILEGEGALNNIRERDAREPIVEVEDENHRPVAGVAVLFASADSSGGAGATFNTLTNTLTSLQVTTGADGVARATGFHPNRVPGHYGLNVTATLGSIAATVVISEINFLGPLNSQSETPTSTSRAGRLGHKIATNQPIQWVLAGAVVAGAIVTGIALTNGSQGTVITPGTGTVAAPSVLKATGTH